LATKLQEESQCDIAASAQTVQGWCGSVRLGGFEH